MNAVIFVFLCVLLWVSAGRGGPAEHVRNVVATAINTLMCGNLTYLAAPWFMSWARKLRGARLWVFLLAVGLVLGAVGVGLAAILIQVFQVYPHGSFRSNLIGGGRVALVVDPLAVVILYIYLHTRVSLETRAVELERAVQTGAARLQQQDEDFQKAREIQDGLLPKTIAQIPGCEIDGVWQPALAVGGDYYDVVPLSDSAIGFAIADVVGKGISAALLMANLQAAFRAYASGGMDPREVCQKINAVMCSNIAPGKFVTFFYGVLDVSRLRLTYSNAGHNPPLLLRGGEVAGRLDQGGALLGVFPDWTFDQETVALQSGDRIVLFTDGITEAENAHGEDFGDDTLAELARANSSLSAAALKTKLLSTVAEFCGNNFRDDATLLVVAIP